MGAINVKEAIEQLLSPDRYYRCLLLVAEDTARLEKTAEDLAAERGWQALRIGPLLAGALIDIPKRQWGRAACDIIRHALAAHQPPVVCYGIELLFEPDLSIDPLALFQDISRSTLVVIAWPGRYEGGVLCHAVPEHAHYHTWNAPDVVVTSLNE